MFTDIGKSTLALTNITFEGIQRGDNIQIFDEYGDVTKTIEWVRQRVNGVNVYKWNDESYVFQLGDSFWLRPQGVVTTKFAGEVELEDPLVISAAANVFTQMGNGTAAPVAITNITFAGIQRGDNIQIFDAYGDVTKTIEWVRQRVNGVNVYKWNDDSYVFQPGEAFWLRPQGAVTVTFPVPRVAD